MRVPRRLVLGLFGFVLPGLTAAAVDGISVDVQPPTVVRRTFDLAHPPSEMPPLQPLEVGQCVYEFACEMETRAVQPAGLGAVRIARVTGTVFVTRLNVTLWTPIDGPPGVLEHEEGHRLIAEFYYRLAHDVAHRLGEEVLATPLHVPGRGRSAMESALNALQDRVIKSYLAQTLARCTTAQRRFDELTQHSRARVEVDDAITRAIAEETAAYEQSAAFPPIAPARRAPPTRPRSS